jgi:hypothetical protein
MHSGPQARQDTDVTVPQTVIVQRWVPWWLLQSRHLWKNWHESDFAGRVAAAAVRRNAQASSKILVFFMSLHLLGIGVSPWGPTKTVPQML